MFREGFHVSGKIPCFGKESLFRERLLVMGKVCLLAGKREIHLIAELIRGVKGYNQRARHIFN